MNALLCREPSTREDDCVSTLHDSIETNLWLAEGYAWKGDHDLACECLRSAWHEYVRFGEILRAYTGGDSLRDRLVAALVRSGDEALAGLALNPDGQPPIWAAAAL